MQEKITSKEAFEKLDQMLEYRHKELQREDRSPYVKGLVQKEIDTLEFLRDLAKQNDLQNNQ